MPLTKSKGNMYPWVTHTHTHLGGECSHECSYCYVQAMAKRFPAMMERHSGSLKLLEKELHVKYGNGRTIFIEHCNDLFANEVPSTWIQAVLDHCREYPDNEYVFQTKNPERYRAWLESLPPKRILGCTIETTDQDVVAMVSTAPHPYERKHHIEYISGRGERVFITIEPILDGDMGKLARWCDAIHPEFVNIGADSKGGELPEPSADKVRELISTLRTFEVEIREKHNLGRLLPELDA